MKWKCSKQQKEVKSLKNKDTKLEMEVIAQHTMHKNEYDIMMTKHEKECDARAEKHEEEYNAMAEEYKRKLENERSLHVQECAKLRKEHKQIQAKENQRRVSMAKNYRAELKVSSYFHSTLSCMSVIT